MIVTSINLRRFRGVLYDNRYDLNGVSFKKPRLSPCSDDLGPLAGLAGFGFGDFDDAAIKTPAFKLRFHTDRNQLLNTSFTEQIG